MLDDFFIRAILASVGIAIMAGPVGCFVVWQRLSYFGDTMAHSALLGVALAFLLHINITLSVFITSMILAVGLLILQNYEKISNDSILGILAHSTLACGLLLVGFMSWIRVDLMDYLFGDILATSKTDVITIWFGCFLLIALMIKIWPILLAYTVNEELALAEVRNAKYIKFIFMILFAILIAIAMKMIGVLLITALLIIPPSTAQKFSGSPEWMAVFSSIIGIIAAIAGLECSYYYDTRSGASIVVFLFFIFLISRIIILFKNFLVNK